MALTFGAFRRSYTLQAPPLVGVLAAGVGAAGALFLWDSIKSLSAMIEGKEQLIMGLKVAGAALA